MSKKSVSGNTSGPPKNIITEGAVTGGNPLIVQPPVVQGEGEPQVTDDGGASAGSSQGGSTSKQSDGGSR